MKSINIKFIIFLSVVLSGCITQFIPETDENQDLLVVEGLVTDQPEAYKIKLSLSMPLGKGNTVIPLKGCTVYITDDIDNTHLLNELNSSGVYYTDPGVFVGETGRKYTLHINTNNSTDTHYSYESLPMELRPVPSIDSLFYEKLTLKEGTTISGPQEGCEIYLNTEDPEGLCRYYRWDYTETWLFKLPYFVTNQICWITYNSSDIHIKSTSVLVTDRINRLPVKFISNESDRLSKRYSILVNQYSINEDEYSYWDKLKNISEEVGGLYDITPATIPGNIFCVEDPSQQVLGYFSVSAKSSKRIYIEDSFRGLVNLYSKCPVDTIGYYEAFPSWYWVIEADPFLGYKVLTDKEYCADCTTRGTTIKPDFWIDQ